VIDASVALQVCVAGGVLGPLAGYQLHAPALLASEVASALRQLAWRDQITLEVARRAAAQLPDLRPRYAQPGSLVTDALEIAAQLGWMKTYDAEYVALARRLRCPLVTLDARLARGARTIITTRAPDQL
jgi:predicted nucleic acid-binding protein